MRSLGFERVVRFGASCVARHQLQTLGSWLGRLTCSKQDPLRVPRDSVGGHNLELPISLLSAQLDDRDKLLHVHQYSLMEPLMPVIIHG